MTAPPENGPPEPLEGVNQARPSDEQVLAHLGGAALLCWNDLSLQCQTRILSQANDVIGLTPLPNARDEIVKLLLRHAKS
jgi:hypothetical protein